jgi:hypothetical protein
MSNLITKDNNADSSHLSSLHSFCDNCKERLAEIFQVNGDYCLECWQELTYPDV